MKDRIWQLARRYTFDALILVGVLIVPVEMILGRRAEEGPRGSLWFLIPAGVAMIVPLLLRRRFPFAAPTAVFVIAAASSFVEERMLPYSFVLFLAVLAACFLFGTLRERSQGGAGLAIAIAATVVVVRNDPAGSIDDYAFVTIIFATVWAAGFALSRKLAQAKEAEERAARLEREHEEQARLARSEERARLARELHDVVGHSVSVMTVQASAVRRLLLPEQEKEREALEIVEQTGRQALAEMRRLVDVLRRPEEAPALAPQPSIEHLDKLVAQVRESGLPVELRVEGEAVRLPAGVDLTAYRLVQEGLTNALKHARADRAEVFVRYGEGEIELEVTDNGTGGGDGSSGGHGLVGMRERIGVYGGELDAAPRPEGGFRLRARLPVEV